MPLEVYDSRTVNKIEQIFWCLVDSSKGSVLLNPASLLRFSGNRVCFFFWFKVVIGFIVVTYSCGILILYSLKVQLEYKVERGRAGIVGVRLRVCELKLISGRRDSARVRLRWFSVDRTGSVCLH